jgi:hypothetical protein
MGKRFFLPAGDLIDNQVRGPLRPFTIPVDVGARNKAVVNVSAPDWAGRDNRLSCAVFLVPDGGTLFFDGTNYSVIQPTIPENPPAHQKGCLSMVLMLFIIIFGISYFLV